jgi:hypothetical protein
MSQQWNAYSQSVFIPQVSSANTPTISSAATAAAANPKRKSILIQNNGTNTLYVLFGNGATVAFYHVALKAGAALQDGSGGSIYNNEYLGIITIAGTSPIYTVLEL